MRDAHEDVLSEAARADAKFGQFHSSHEGLGVLREECVELEEAIRANNAAAIYAEAVQVAAVATRIAESLSCPAFRKRSCINRATGRGDFGDD